MPLAFAVLLATLSVDPAGAALDHGRPACDYCRMILSDPSFGAEIRTRSGGRRIYDAVECIAAAVLTDSVPPGEIVRITLVDHDAPHASLPLDRAVLAQCPSLESPMGLSLAAFTTRGRALRACRMPAGRLLDWRGVLTLVDSTWFQGRLSVDRHASVRGPEGRRTRKTRTR